MARKEKRGKKRTQDDHDEDPVEHEEAATPKEGNEVALSEEEDEAEKSAPPAPTTISDGRYRNKQRCLISCSRGITARFRHLLEDLRTLIPHHKKESKLDPGSDGVGRAISDIAEMRGCNTVLFLECRKRQDAYLWLGKNSGPSVRFHVSNIHTMDELKLTGNCMKGSRPILSFDESFTRLGHLKLMKELFVDIFGTPRGHPKSKPFVDRVMCFYYADKKVRLNSAAFCILYVCRSSTRASMITTMMSVCRTDWDENKTSFRLRWNETTSCCCLHVS